MITFPAEPSVREQHSNGSTPKPHTDVEASRESSSDPRASEEPSVPRLYRSATDRVIFGVCGGLADYFLIDAALVRLAFAIATLWGGAGLLLYVVLAIILPVGRPRGGVPYRTSLDRTQLLAGVVLIVLGGLLLVSNMGFAPWLTWNLFWPSLVILLGVGLLVERLRSGNHDSGA
jgi:phage shock protein PspC (stress-responsive transcriptional regulator)